MHICYAARKGHNTVSRFGLSVLLLSSNYLAKEIHSLYL